MAARSVPRAICCCPEAAAACLRAQAVRSRRTFSSTTARRKNGVLPTFYPTPLQPLSDLLSQIRSKIFVPSHLKPAQLDLIYRSKNHTLLRTDPVRVTLGPEGATEEILLEPIDRTKDVPNSWRAVRDALALMAGSSDGEIVNGKQWANLVPLLEGMRTAGRRWKPWQWSYIARQAGEAGAAHALLEAARQCETTGLFLYDLRVVREVLWACRAKTSRDDWDAASTTKGLAYAEQVMRLLEDKRQGVAAQKALHKGELTEIVNPGTMPDVLGIVLELAAKRVQALQAEEASQHDMDAAQEVLTGYVTRVVPALPKVKELSGSNILHVPAAAAADYELLRWVPLMNGLQMAQNLLGDTAIERETLNRSLSQLEKNITEAKETVQENVGGDEGGKRRGFRWAQAAVPA